MIALILSLALLAPCPASRDPKGGFKRERAVIQKFLKTPQGICPSTRTRIYPCPGYQAHHAVWLSCGGTDTPDNLVWLSVKQHRALHAKTKCKEICTYPGQRR